MTALAHSLRVLVVLPLYGGSLPVGRFCVEGLKEQGHTVEVFEAPSFHSAFSALKDLRVTTDRLEYLENSFLQVVSQAVLAKVETFEPDLVLCLAQAPLNRQALKRLRKDGVATAMWFVEDYRLFTYWRGFAPFYDFFAVIQHEPFLSELRDIGVENALYLPMAALPSMHRKLELSSAEQRKYGSDVSFLGAGYPNRRIAFRQLTHLDFKIWGTEWDGEPLLERHVQMKGARISSEDCVKIYNATKINLNLHSSVDARELVSGGDFVNPRTFELAACGAFQLVDRRTLMRDLFDSDELVTFGSMEELLDKIQTYLGDESARVAVAEKAKARVLRDHTYAARMRTLTEFIASRREGWPAPRKESAALPADIPAELREELAALMQRLGIPADAAFQDIVWAIRQQNGQLSSVETAVLFLDEWKKQYQQ
ncbi:CgeB family protein [Desulfovibrio subterraneus]|uniref:CgeB family protein n=1 Tax=Desulfovibrio subterraneus TaxID=2718620 RepID=A0A7J0BJP1_9BACT|nr:glycosyltransferase [Desulfovibrio subterraneus]GFM33957.1 CgeB family protein [Desulfovibrio subterraneus]